MTKLLYIFVLLSCFDLSGQVDSIQNIQTVHVSTLLLVLKEKSHSLVFDRETIDELQPTDISDLLRKVPGVNLRSYGGLGGLKTVSMRSLGANHSSIIVDGVPLNNSQTGQVNLGQLMVDNVEQLTSSIGLNSNYLIPVSSQISGSNFMINTMENSFARDTLTIRANVGYGSFGQIKGYAGVKYNPNKYFISAFGAMQKAKGNYRYSLDNGLLELNGTRKNNEYFDYNFGVSGGVKFKKGQWRIGFRHKSIQQELPGAVIFYLQTADEQLTTKGNRLFTDLKWTKNKFYSNVFLNGSIDNQEYFDPTYLNAVGEIDTKFNNRNLNGGYSFMRFSNNWKVFGGVEETVSDLLVNDSTFAEPVRFHSYAMIGVRYDISFFTLTGQISAQHVYEENRIGLAPKKMFRVNPFFSIKTKEWGQRSQVELWYRNSFRMPTFNELYYTNIGNLNLIPEDAHQVNLGYLWSPHSRRMELDWKSNIFFNHIENKIVAVPTKNLFIWSMQNIGRVNAFGGDFQFEAKYKFNDLWQSIFNLSYTYQKTIDVTDSDSPTYLHQVAYIPEHTANADISVKYHNTGLRLSSYYISMRYTLNENILANELNGFVLMDISVFHTFKLDKKEQLKIIGSVKNVFNSSYAYIRSYVMPGINYSISLSYAFN